MRNPLPAMAIMALLASPALAQQAPPDQPPPAPPQAAQPQAAQPGQPTAEQSLKEDPNVARSQDPMPTPQGTRAPQSGMTDTKHETLTAVLERVWASPADIQGNPIARPNPLASGPPPMKNPEAGMAQESPKP